MATSKDSIVRKVNEGYGINGVTLNLSLAHIYSLMALQAECKMAMEQTEQSTPAHNLAHQTKSVLDFIVGDIKSPFDPTIWKVEENLVEKEQ